MTNQMKYETEMKAGKMSIWTTLSAINVLNVVTRIQVNYGC